MESKESPEIQASPEELKVSSAEELKKRFEVLHKARKLKLPSGFVVEISQPDMFGMIQSGNLPVDLIDFAINIKSKYKSVKGKEEPEIKDKNDLPKFFDFMKLLVINSVVNPKIVEQDPKDNEILYDYLDSEDRMFIFMEVASGGKPLETFRKEKQKFIDDAGQSVPKVSKPKTK